MENSADGRMRCVYYNVIARDDFADNACDRDLPVMARVPDGRSFENPLRSGPTFAHLIPSPGLPFDYAAPKQAYPYPISIPHPYHLLPPIVSSTSDDRQYSAFILSNGLRCCVVSDPHSSEAACSLDVIAGYQSDGGMSGCAHLLEHVLTQGSDKYPEENGYKKFIATRGGKSNASTNGQHTKFYFKVNATDLEPALDRFASFFTCPSFHTDAIIRAVDIVDSEYVKNVNTDSKRIWHYTKATGNPCCPESQFGSGNKATLLFDREALGQVAKMSDDQCGTGALTPSGACVSVHAVQIQRIRQQLMDFFDVHYSANNMCVCVVGKEPISVLRNLCVEKFGGVQNSNKIPEYPEIQDVDPWAPMPLQQLQALLERTNVSYTMNPMDAWAPIRERRYILPEYVMHGRSKYHDFLKSSNKSLADCDDALFLAPGLAFFSPHSSTDIPGVTASPSIASSHRVSSPDAPVNSGAVSSPAAAMIGSSTLVHDLAYPGVYGQVSYILPVAKYREVRLSWKLPPLRRSWPSSPINLLASMIGDKGIGAEDALEFTPPLPQLSPLFFFYSISSLYAWLCSRGHVTGLTCEFSSGLGAGKLCVYVTPTAQGMHHIDTIVKSVFEYLLLICNTSNQHLIALTHDLIGSANHAFNSKRKRSPSALARQLASDLHEVTSPPLLPLSRQSSLGDYPHADTMPSHNISHPSAGDLFVAANMTTHAPSLLLRYGDTVTDMQIDSVHHVLALLTPSRVRIDVIAPEVAETVPLTLREGHYGVVYGAAKIMMSDLGPADVVQVADDICESTETTLINADGHPACKMIGLNSDPSNGVCRPFQLGDSVVCDEYGHGLLVWPWMSAIEQHMIALLSPYSPDHVGFRNNDSLKSVDAKATFGDERALQRSTSPLVAKIQERLDPNDLTFQSVASDVLQQYLSINGCRVRDKVAPIKAQKIRVEPLPPDTPLNTQGLPEKWTWELLGLMPVSFAVATSRKRDVHTGVICNTPQVCEMKPSMPTVRRGTIHDVPAQLVLSNDEHVNGETNPGGGLDSPECIMPDAWYLRQPTPEEMEITRSKYPNNTSVIELSILTIRERIPVRYRIQADPPILIHHSNYIKSWFLPNTAHVADKVIHKMTIFVSSAASRLSAHAQVYFEILSSYLSRFLRRVSRDAVAEAHTSVRHRGNSFTLSVKGSARPCAEACILMSMALRQAISTVSLGNIASSDSTKDAAPLLDPYVSEDNELRPLTPASDVTQSRPSVKGLDLDILNNVADSIHRAFLSSENQDPKELARKLVNGVMHLNYTPPGALIHEMCLFRQMLSDATEAHSSGDILRAREVLEPFFSYVGGAFAKIRMLSLSSGCARDEALSVAKAMESIITGATTMDVVVGNKVRDSAMLSSLEKTPSNDGERLNTVSDMIDAASHTTSDQYNQTLVAVLQPNPHVTLPRPIEPHTSDCAIPSSLRPTPLNDSDRVRDEVVVLQPGEHVFLRVHAASPSNQNSVACVSFRLNEISAHEKVCAQALDVMISKRLYDRLRTKECLGYRVSVKVEQGEFRILVQGTQDATYLYHRIETALYLIREELGVLPDADFFTVVNALIDRCKVTKSSFSKFAKSRYNSLVGETDELMEGLESLRVLRKIQKQDVLQFMDKYILGYGVDTVTLYEAHPISLNSTATDFAFLSLEGAHHSTTSAVTPKSFDSTGSCSERTPLEASATGFIYNDGCDGLHAPGTRAQNMESLSNGIPLHAKVISPTTRSVVVVLVNKLTQPFPSHPCVYTPVRAQLPLGRVEGNYGGQIETAHADVSFTSSSLEPTVVLAIPQPKIVIISDISAFQSSRKVKTCTN